LGNTSPEATQLYMPISSLSSLQRLGLLLLALLALVSACLPWFRHYDYLRDFMDYGLVMSAVGRINAGEHPYVDFVTPIQAGFFYINRIFETLGGGSYIAMTYGALALIVTAGVGLTLMARRWLPWWAAIPVGWSIVVCTATQHTIVWYNALGTLCLAGALWSVAAAPYFRRADWVWHVAFAVCLILGGLNKISYQFIAVVGSCGFLVRAALLPEGSWRKLGPMLALTLGAGIVIPLAIELVLTGASLSQWRYNVLELASGGRAEYLLSAASLNFYLKPMHDYYGPLFVPQIGAIIVALMVIILVLGVWSTKALDRILFVVATVGGLLVGLALLATNHEIAHMAFGSALALAVALGIAFKLNPSPAVVGLVLVAPSLLLGGAAWSSAWKGQRSQFGHSSALRSDYREISDSLPEFHYISGLHIPPEMADSCESVVNWMPETPAGEPYPVMFTNGVEWLDRVWPTVRYSGLPLWLADGTSCGPIERELLQKVISPPSRIERIFAAIAWDQWPSPAVYSIELLMRDQNCGPMMRVYSPIGSSGISSDPMKGINRLNLNFMPSLLALDGQTAVFSSHGDRLLLGSMVGTSHFNFEGIVNTMQAEMVISRRIPDQNRAISTNFRVTRSYGDSEVTEWEDQLELPAGQDEISHVIKFDGQQQLLRFYTIHESDSNGDSVAGWFPPVMLHAKADDNPPPDLFTHPKPAVEVTEAMRSALLKTEWQPDQIIFRGGRLTEQGFEIPPGGQVWLRADRGLSSLDGMMRQPTGSTGPPATVRVLWYQGGRVQITSFAVVTSSSDGHGFHSWSPDNNGWFGIVVDPHESGAPVLLEIHRADPQP
jgi:MFS family permease